MLHHPETQSTGLINSLKKQELCVLNVRSDVNVRNRLSGQQEGNNSMCKKKCATFSTTGWALKRHCLGNLSFLCKMKVRQPLSEDGIARRYRRLLEENPRS
jgi:hypothetical protein